MQSLHRSLKRCVGLQGPMSALYHLPRGLLSALMVNKPKLPQLVKITSLLLYMQSKADHHNITLLAVPTTYKKNYLQITNEQIHKMCIVILSCFRQIINASSPKVKSQIIRLKINLKFFNYTFLVTILLLNPLHAYVNFFNIQT